jgi:hypothetical protein
MTLAYQLGKRLSEMTHHVLLMAVMPHKGDPDNFRLFLKLLDKDVYGDIQRIEEAMRGHVAPFISVGSRRRRSPSRSLKPENEIVPSVDLAALPEEIARLVRLVDKARALEARDINDNVPWNPVRLEQPPRLESLDVHPRRPEYETDGNFS